MGIQEKYKVVLISGSPSETSRSDYVLKYLEMNLKQHQVETTYISIQEVPFGDLFYANFNSSFIKGIIETIHEADGVIIGSPVYQGSYTGVLKTLLDLLPQNVFQSKVVLPIMVGGSPSHLLALDYTLKPLIALLKGQSLRGVYILDTLIDRTKDNPIIDDEINERIDRQFNRLLKTIRKKQSFIH